MESSSSCEDKTSQKACSHAAPSEGNKNFENSTDGSLPKEYTMHRTPIQKVCYVLFSLWVFILHLSDLFQLFMDTIGKFFVLLSLFGLLLNPIRFRQTRWYHAYQIISCLCVIRLILVMIHMVLVESKSYEEIRDYIKWVIVIDTEQPKLFVHREDNIHIEEIVQCAICKLDINVIDCIPDGNNRVCPDCFLNHKFTKCKCPWCEELCDTGEISIVQIDGLTHTLCAKCRVVYHNSHKRGPLCDNCGISLSNCNWIVHNSKCYCDICFAFEEDKILDEADEDHFNIQSDDKDLPLPPITRFPRDHKRTCFQCGPFDGELVIIYDGSKIDHLCGRCWIKQRVKGRKGICIDCGKTDVLSFHPTFKRTNDWDAKFIVFACEECYIRAEGFVPHSEDKDLILPLQTQTFTQYNIKTHSFDVITTGTNIKKEPCEYKIDQTIKHNLSQEVPLRSKKNKTYKSSKGMAPELQNFGFADGCGFTIIRPKIDPTWKCPTGFVFDDTFHRGIELNSFLVSLKYEDVDSILGSYCNMNPSKFQNLDQKELFLDFKRGLNMVRRKWNQSDSGVRALKDFLAAYQTVQTIGVTNHLDLKLPCSNTKFEQHPVIKFPELSKEYFQATGKGKYHIEPLLQRSVMEPNILFNVISQCTSHSRMLTIKKIKSICKQFVNDKMTREELVTYFEQRCYIWRKQWKEPNYSSLSWIVNFIPPEWYYYIVRDDEEYLHVFQNMILELRSSVLKFVNEYYDISLLSDRERKLLKQNRSKIFATEMRTPQIQERFLSGETKQDIVNDIYMVKTQDIFKDAMKTGEMINFSNEKVKKKFLSIKKARDAKFAGDSFEEHSWEGIAVGSIMFMCFLIFVYKELQKSTPKIIQLLENANNTLNQAKQKVELVTKLCEKAEPIIGDLEKHFEKYAPQTQVVIDKANKVVDSAKNGLDSINNVMDTIQNFVNGTSNIPDSYTKMAGAIKLMAESIYLACYGRYGEAVNQLSTVLIMYPQLLLTFKDKLFQCSGYALEQVNEINIRWKGKDLRVPSDKVDDLFERNNVDEFDDPDRFTVQAFDSITDFIAPFVDVLNIFKSDDMSQLEMQQANTRFQYIFYNKRFWEDKVSMIKGIISWIGRELFDYDPFNPDIAKFGKELLDVITFVDSNLQDEIHLVTNHELCREVLKVMDKANDLNNNIKMERVSTHLSRLFDKKRIILERMSLKAKPLLKGTCERQEPLTILFTGPAECGKSTAIKHIAKGLSILNGFDFDESKVFTYNPATEYFDTYDGQYHFMFDELFANADPSVRALQAEMLIKMINTMPYPLNMAECEAKGKMFFNSQVIYLSTNVANNGYKQCELLAGLQDNNAFWRRMHIIIHRDIKYDMRNHIEHELFRVDKCNWFPEAVGKTYTCKQLVFLARKCQQNMRALQDTYYTKERIREIYLNSDDPFGVDLPTNQSSTFTEQSLASDISDYMGVYFNKFIPESNKTYRNMFYGFVFLATTLTIGCTAYSLFNTWNSSNSNEFKTEAYDADYYARKYRKKPISKHVKQKIIEHKFEVQSSEHNFLNANLALTKCLAHITIKDAAGNVYSDSKWSHLKDGFMVGTAHSINRFQGREMYIDMTWFQGHSYFLMPLKSIKALNEDLYMFELPDKSNMPKQMYNHLWKPQHWEEIDAGRAMKMIMVRKDGQAEILSVNRAAFDGPHPYTTKYGESYIVERPVTYFGGCENGHSGALLTMEGPNGLAIIVGMHCGEQKRGTTYYGVALPFTQSSFDKLLEQGKDLFTTQELEPTNLPFTKYEITKDVHYVPRKDTLKKSRMYGWVTDEDVFEEPPEEDPVKIPAILVPFINSDGEFVDPLVLALKKMSQEPCDKINFPERMYTWFLNLYKGGTKRVLDVYEALRGNPELGIPSIILNTSPGWPFNLARMKGKSPYIFRDEDGVLQYEDSFLQRILRDLERIKNGEDIDVVFCDLLKVETRPIEKVLKGKTRLFSACPLHYLILARMYFLDFAMFVQSKASTHPISVGIDPHSLDWHKLRARILRKARSLISGDFENYDGTVHADLIWAFCEVVNRWYDDGEENARIRRKLIEYIVYSKHVVYEFIYQLTKGNPSGNPFTSILNSVCLMFILYIVFTEDFGLREDQFEMAVYGDDNGSGLDADGYTAEDLTEPIWRRFKMKYTHSSKKTGVRIVDTIDTFTYLGRSFKMYDSICHAPLSKTTICESIYWLDRTEESVAMISSAQSLAVEASHLGREEFNELIDKFLNAVRKRMPDLYNVISSSIKSFDYYFESKYVAGKHVNFGFRIQECDPMYYEPWQEDTFCYFTAQDAEPSRDIKSFVVLFPETTEPTINPMDRGMDDPVLTQTTRIGNYVDSNPVVMKSDDVSTNIVNMNNVETYNYNKALEREYLIYTGTISSSQARSTVLQTLNFPHALFAIDFIGKVSEYYQGFKAGVKVTIRTSASSFDYGALAADWYPLKLGTDTNVDAFQPRSGRDHGLLFYEECNALIMTFPFIHPGRYLDTTNHYADEIGALTLTVAAALRNINGNTESITVNVTAQFVDVELSWPLYRTTAPTAIKKSEPRKMITDDGDYFKVQSKEMYNKDTNSSYSKVFNVAAAAANVLAPNLTNFTRVVKRELGFDKPRSLNLDHTPQASHFQTDFYGKGQTTMKAALIDPESSLGEVNYTNGPDDESKILTVASTPQSFNNFSITSAYTPTVISNLIDIADATYVDYIASMFNFWSGSIKYKFYFVASKMHNVKVVFYLAPASAPTDGNGWQSGYHKIVDINGTTRVDFTIPYSDHSPMMRTGQVPDFVLWMAVLSFSQPVSTGPTSIDVLSYKAAGPDFRVASPRDLQVTFTPNSIPREDFKVDFLPLHPSMKQYIIDGLTAAESPESIRDLTHVMYSYGAPSGSSGDITIWPRWSYGVANTYNGIYLWQIFYLFRRGGFRLKYFNKNQNNVGIFLKDPNSGYWMTTTDTTSAVKPTGELEMPQITGATFGLNRNLSYPAGVNYTDWTYKFSGTTTVQTFIGGDDSFCYSYIFPPPSGTAISNFGAGGSQGMRGFQNYLT